MIVRAVRHTNAKEPYKNARCQLLSWSQLVIEGMYGQSYSRPVRHLDEYLSCLLPPLSLEPVDFEGESLTAKATLGVPGAHPVPVLVAALGPKMLDLAARRTAGTITWMTGPTTLREHTVPTLTAAAAAADLPAPRVVAALPVAVTDDPDGVRAKAAKVFSVYGFLPSYRAMLDREGAAGPADVAVVGSAAEVRAGLERVAEAGVTDFVAVEFVAEEPVRRATRDVLKELV